MSKRQAEIVLGYLRRLAPEAAASASDRQLLERFAAGREEAAFAALLDRHGAMVLRVCQRILHDAHEAEDAFQATFLILAGKCGTIRQHQSVASWLYKVAYHVAVRARADAARRQQLPARTPRRPVADPLAEVSGRELLQVLDDELRRLPEKYRAPLLLCYLEGRTQDEAARQLGWSPHVLRGRVERGRAVLRRRLVRRGFGLSVALAGTLLEQAPAAVPALLSARTLRAAVGSSIEQAVVSAEVAALVESGVHALGAAKMKPIASLLLILSLTAIGGGVAALQAPTEKPPPVQASPPPVKDVEAKKPTAIPRRDSWGDPLPAQVLARLGTSRLRHGGWFTAMAYSPDGKTIASSAHDGTVRLWDAATGKAIRLLGRERERRIPYSISRWLFCLAFSPDGKRIAAGEHVQDQPAGSLHVWDTATGKEELRFVAHPGGVFAVAFSPDGKTLASSGAKDGKVRLWDAAGGRVTHVLDAGEATRWLAFTPNGKTLASAGGKTIRLWNIADGEERKQLQGHRDDLSGIAFSPDGKVLASVGKDKTLRIWNAVTGRERNCWIRSDIPDGIAFSPDGKTVATGGIGPIVLCNAATGKEERTLRHPDGDVTALAFSPDGKTLATSTNGERCFRLWDLTTGQERRESAAGHHGGIGFLRFSPDGQALLSAGWEDLEMCRWKTTGERIWQLHRGLQAPVKPVDLSPDGKVLAAGTQTGTILLVDALSGEELRHYEAHHAPIESVAFSPDGKTLASSANDKTLCLWNVASHRLQRSLETSAAVSFLSFSPNGKILASAASSGPIELRDADSGRIHLSLADWRGRYVCALTFSPDNRWLAAGTNEGSIRIWETASGKQVCRLNGHTGFVFGLAFSHDGRTVAAGSWMQLRLWETATGHERAYFTELEGDVFALDFAPGDRMLASGQGDGSILLWDVTGRVAGKRPTPGEVEVARTDLLGDDASKAYQALWTLASVPPQAMPWLKKQLKPVVGGNQREMNRLIRQMDDDNFVVREAAMRDLAKEAEWAEPLLRKALEDKPSAELRRRIGQLLEPFAGPLPSVERVRQIRLLELLEQIGTKEAEEWLKTLAGGAPGVFLTREAKASLERRARRSTP